MVDSSKPPLLGTSSTSVNKLEQYGVPLKRKSTAQDQDTHRSQPEYVSDKEGPKMLIFSTLSFLCFSLAHLSECDDTLKVLSNHQEVKNIMYNENHRTDYQEDTLASLQTSYWSPTSLEIILKNLIIYNHQERSIVELMDTEKHKKKYKRTMQAPRNYSFSSCSFVIVCLALSSL